MLTPVLSLGAAGLYLGAGALLIKHLRGRPLPGLRPVFALSVLALLVHGVLLYATVLPQSAAAINIGLTNAASLSAWILTVIFIATALIKPAYELGTIILPVAAVGVLAAWLWPPAVPETVTSAGLAIHYLISLIAYGFLALAVVQSVLMALQDHRLRVHREASVLHSLPPLETMERLLFQLIVIGFALLSLGLLSGFWFSREVRGVTFPFNHHTVLSVAAWVIFGSLLFGRRRFGWRGKTAVRWTIGGFIVLVLAFFGWKFVLEILLNRP